MKGLYILWVVSACAYGNISASSVKGVTSSDYTTGQSNTRSNRIHEIGVCYIHRDGSTADVVNTENYRRENGYPDQDLSVIRTCCRGYIRSSYDPMVCQPVCSEGCINAVCVAPETCQCYQGFVRNTAGICTLSCPRGCQNGHCAGDECICDFGYRWDSERSHCVPKCKYDCSGLGTCIAPNTCSCHPGYQTTAEGSCEGETAAACEHCYNGTCVNNNCQCHRGYSKDAQGYCKPQCHTACPRNSECIGPNVCSAPTTYGGSQEYQVLYTNSKPQHSANQVESSSHSQQQQNVDRDNYNQQQQNHQYPNGHQNMYNPYGSQPLDSYNQRSNSQSQQETYRRQQESYDRNQGARRYDSTQHQSQDNHQRSYETPQQSYDPSQRNQHVDRNTQSTSSSNQYDTEYGRYQNSNQGRNPSSQDTYGSSQQRPYDTPRRESESINQGNYDSRQGSYRTQERPYPYSNSETPEAHNQMYSHHGSPYTDQNINQQTNIPVCSMPCINGHCVEGNQCRCKPGYIPDQTNPSVCQPDCPGGCPNGVCSAPRLCLCNVGYYKDNSVKGRPVCVKRT